MFFLLLIVFSTLPRLSAHSAPGSALVLDFHTDRVDAELRLPISELELSFRQPLTAEPEKIFARHRAALADYVRAHLALRAPDDRAWTVTVGEMRIALSEQPIDLIVQLTLTPPTGVSPRRFTLHSDVISHEVINHFTVVAVRSDWNNALLSGEPVVIGVLRPFAHDLAVDRTAGSAWSGFLSVLNLGVHHIAEGTDHLLFLLVLLLPAPLLASGKRWTTYGGLRHSTVSLLKIVTAFTLGHSLTLIIGALGWLQLPPRPVEVLIAVSILISALHALRPIFPGREPLIAAGFGLIHGLAFATVLAEFKLDAWHFAAALLAFNLGIELMQLLVVAVTVPWLILLSRTAFYPVVRIGGAIFGGVAALGWIAERACEWPNPIGTAVEQIAARALWLVALLALVSVLASLITARSARKTTPA